MSGDAPLSVPEEETGNQRLAILLAMEQDQPNQ